MTSPLNAGCPSGFPAHEGKHDLYFEIEVEPYDQLKSVESIECLNCGAKWYPNGEVMNESFLDKLTSNPDTWPDTPYCNGQRQAIKLQPRQHPSRYTGGASDGGAGEWYAGYDDARKGKFYGQPGVCICKTRTGNHTMACEMSDPRHASRS